MSLFFLQLIVFSMSINVTKISLWKHILCRKYELKGKKRHITDLKRFFTAENAEVRRGFIDCRAYGAIT